MQVKRKGYEKYFALFRQAQLSQSLQRGRVRLRVIEYFTKTLKVIRNDNVE